MSPAVPKPPKRKKKPRKPIRRRRVRQKAGKPKRFAKRRDPEYVAWIRTLPCVFAGRFGHQCQGPVEACHYKSRGAGGNDYANLFPSCRQLHRQQHDIGLVTFCERWYSQGDGNALERLATVILPERYDRERSVG